MRRNHQVKKILVVEDRENWRTTFCNFLNNLGYETIEATCGTEFKENATEADVIILDISMPEAPDTLESKTAGLDALIELQLQHDNHPAIQNPIIRSMWEREDFKKTRYENVKVGENRWCSRNVSIAELLDLINETPLS